PGTAKPGTSRTVASHESAAGTRAPSAGPQRPAQRIANGPAGSPHRTGARGYPAPLETPAGRGAANAGRHGRAASAHGPPREPIAHERTAPAIGADRSDMQRAAEAASQGAASQALASGTRAQRQLQDMREQLRKQNSSEFSDDLRQMRADARDIARQQDDILQKMQEEKRAEQQ